MTLGRYLCVGISGILLVFWSCVGMAQQGVEKANTPFQLCCASSLADAQDVARRCVASIPGLQTRIDKESCQDALGHEVDSFALYVWHETMTAREICQKLGQRECDRCLKHGRDICPESQNSSKDQEN